MYTKITDKPSKLIINKLSKLTKYEEFQDEEFKVLLNYYITQQRQSPTFDVPFRKEAGKLLKMYLSYHKLNEKCSNDIANFLSEGATERNDKDDVSNTIQGWVAQTANQNDIKAISNLFTILMTIKAPGNNSFADDSVRLFKTSSSCWFNHHLVIKVEQQRKELEERRVTQEKRNSFFTLQIAKDSAVNVREVSSDSPGLWHQ